jgi:branched-chain amino acid transport system ATP-binding protein
MLEISGLTGGWGPTVIVEDVSFRVRPGETVAILGRNGVGKSTLLELLVGRARRKLGGIRLAGRELSHLTTDRRAVMGLGYVPQQREVFRSLTVREHLAISERPGRWTTDRILALFPSLAQRLGSLGGQLSGGEQQMLAIARALAGNPTVMLMDEPSEGLAPVVVEQLVAAMRSVVQDEAMALLLVEQRVDVALDLAARCLVMDRGRVLFDGNPRELDDGRHDLAGLMGLGAARSTASARG